MKIVIDIPDAEYERIQAMDWKNGDRWYSYETIAIHNGTPVPKGCGRLIDADETLAKAWTNFYAHEDEWQKKDKDYVPIGRFYGQNGFECCQQTIVSAPTIIEADKE